MFPKTWRIDRVQRACIIGERLGTEARFWPHDALHTILHVRVGIGRLVLLVVLLVARSLTGEK